MELDSLAAAINEVEIPLDARAMRRVLALKDRLEAKVTRAVGEFDANRMWDESGAASMRAWLRDEGLASPDATRLERVGSRLLRLPTVAEAWTAGELTGGQVRAIDAHLTDKHVSLFAEHEAELVPTLVGMAVGDTNAVMAEWRARADAVLDDKVDDEPARSFHHSPTLDGRFVSNGGFDPYSGAIIDAALGVADSGDKDVAAPTRRADALTDICRYFLDHYERATTPRRRPHVNLILDAGSVGEDDEPRAELSDYGFVLDGATTARILCDCSFSPMLAERMGKAVSRILHLGRSTDEVSAAQWTALAVRDRHCRYPGCNRKISGCEAHHVRWYRHGGTTDLDNLVLVCSYHHHLIHRKRLEARLLPDASFEVVLPNGTTRTTRPPGAELLLAV